MMQLDIDCYEDDGFAIHGSRYWPIISPGGTKVDAGKTSRHSLRAAVALHLPYVTFKIVGQLTQRMSRH